MLSITITLSSSHVKCVCDVSLTGVAAVLEGGDAPAASQKGKGGCHQPLHDAALPRTQAQAAG